MRGELYRTIMVYVDSYVDCVPAGMFHFASDQDALPFRSLNQLLFDINRTLDREQFPQAFHALRVFHAPSIPTDPPRNTTLPKQGSIATFSIRILFRQNATWQGTLTWTDGNQEVSFRSVLELILLMDNALSYALKK